MLQDFCLWRTITPLLQSFIDRQVAHDVALHLTDLGFGSPRRTMSICAGLFVTISCCVALFPYPVSKDLELESISPPIGFTTVAAEGPSLPEAYAAEECATGGYREVARRFLD